VDQTPARILSVLALASIAAGAINFAAAATVGRGSAQDMAFFVAVGVAQVAWGAVALIRAPRWWLALGGVGNLVVIATWVVSRTVGLPVGQYAGVKLPIGFPDTLATALAALIVVGAAGLLARGHSPARSAVRYPAVAVAAAVVAAGLTVGAVLVQANVIGSTPAGSSHGASVSGRSTHGHGAGNSGSGSYGSGGSSSGGSSSGGSSGYGY
jgi:hypothetical protein